MLDGDAAALPLRDGAVDLVVCSMALLNFDDLDGAVREAARVLEPGGRLCFSTVHPWNSLKGGADYFAERTYAETSHPRRAHHDLHRPPPAAGRDRGARSSGPGLLIEALREPVPDAAHIAAHPEVEQWTRRPAFLLGRAGEAALALLEQRLELLRASWLASRWGTPPTITREAALPRNPPGALNSFSYSKCGAARRGRRACRRCARRSGRGRGPPRWPTRSGSNSVSFHFTLKLTPRRHRVCSIA